MYPKKSNNPISDKKPFFKMALLFSSIFWPAIAYAEDPQWTVKTIFGDVSSDMALENYTSMMLNFIYGIIGLVTILRLILGGYKYMTSSGNAEDAKSAKNTIRHALTGLILVLFAFFMTQLFFGDGTGILMTKSE